MKKSLLYISLLFVILILSGCEKVDLPDTCEKDGDSYTCQLNYLSYFDTSITIILYVDETMTSLELQTIYDDIDELLKTYHQIADKYHTYDGVVNIKTINDDETSTHVLSDELYQMISYSLEEQTKLDNLYNIALGPVLELWHDYRDNCNIYSDDANCTLPLLTDLEEQAQYTDPSKIVLDENTKSITLEENMSLDLGGMTKGYVTKLVGEYLKSTDILGYIINNGSSNISTYGVHPTRENGIFLIGITDPTNVSDHYLVLKISKDKEIITSGDYQQYGITDEVKYHHIIDPTTLYPSRYMHSVTLIYNDAALGDIYSTTLFNMSIEDGLSFVNNDPNLDAVFYGLDGTIYYSEGFRENYIN
jgi:thiamine biosynthesis lipoprotein